MAVENFYGVVLGVIIANDDFNDGPALLNCCVQTIAQRIFFIAYRIGLFTLNPSIFTPPSKTVKNH